MIQSDVAEVQPQVRDVLMKEFEDTLSYYLGTLLKRHLNMKQKDLDKLSLEDKKNYLIIAHMNKI